MNRRASYKAPLDQQEVKNMRAKTTRMIAKQKRDQNLRSRRGMSDEPSYPDAQISLPIIGTRKCTKDDVNSLQSLICGGSSSEIKSVAMKELRRLLEGEGDIHLTISSATLSQCVLHLKVDVANVDQSRPEWRLGYESARMMNAFICMGGQRQSLIDAGVVPPLALLARNADSSMYSMAILCLGNIAASSTSFRDEVLRNSVMEQV